MLSNGFQGLVTPDGRWGRGLLTGSRPPTLSRGGTVVELWGPSPPLLLGWVTLGFPQGQILAVLACSVYRGLPPKLPPWKDIWY